jgi:hypothetical protein
MAVMTEVAPRLLSKTLRINGEFRTDPRHRSFRTPRFDTTADRIRSRLEGQTPTRDSKKARTGGEDWGERRAVIWTGATRSSRWERSLGETGEAAVELVSDTLPSIEASSPPKSPPSTLDQVSFIALLHPATFGEPKAEMFPTALSRSSRPHFEVISLPSGERANSRRNSSGRDRARRVRDGIGSRFGRRGRRKREKRTFDRQDGEGSERRCERVSMRGGMLGCFLSVGVEDRFDSALVMRETAEDRLRSVMRLSVND